MNDGIDPATLGLVTRYRDAFGAWRDCPPGSVGAVASALASAGAASGPDMLPAVIVVRDTETLVLPQLRAAAGGYGWQLHLEDGQVREGRGDAGSVAPVGPVPLGYHRLALALDDGQAVESWVLGAPARTFAPPWFAEPSGTWGFAAQLYSLRSRENWGIGDFGDLRHLLPRAAALGAGAIGLNPLHARFSADPGRISPYSPSSRFFLDPLMIAVPAMAGAESCPALRALLAEPAFTARLEALRAAPLVDYPGVSSVKHAAFRLLHDWFPQAPADLREAFETYKRAGGEPLRRFAAFETLQTDPERMREWWRDWPDGLSVPDEATLARIVEARPAEHDYHMFLQWQADLQLAACAAECRRLGMPVGLYLDLALGVDAGGADAWAEGPALITDVALGAPPDPMNVRGQNWGLPPFNPLVLRRRGHAPFASVLRAAMRHAGAVRLDHVIGLMRLYLVPRGVPASEGVFLLYPIDELLAVLALESVRHRCIVIGEDLGTLPEGLQDKLAAAGVLSYRVVMFEQRDGRFIPPDQYPRDALVVASTHDLPTLEGWLSGKDLEVKAALDLLGEQSLESHRAGREAEKDALRAALVEAGTLDPADRSPDALAVAVHRFIARTPARLVMAQLEDAAGTLDQVNLPGTDREHPNWQRKLPVDTDALFESPRLRAIAAAMAAERPARPRSP